MGPTPELALYRFVLVNKTTAQWHSIAQRVTRRLPERHNVHHYGVVVVIPSDTSQQPNCLPFIFPILKENIAMLKDRQNQYISKFLMLRTKHQIGLL